MITKENTVAEVVTKNMGADHVFSKYNIDFCCGGGMKIVDACKQSGVAFETLKFEIETIKNKINGDVNFKDLNFTSIIEQVKNVHHKYINENILQIQQLAAKVAEVHAQDHKEVVEINILFSKVVSQVTEQISLEEIILFPFIEKFIANDKNEIRKEG